MRIVKLESRGAIDPKRHFLAVLTSEGLSRVPFDLPVFSVVDGRPGPALGPVEAREILLRGEGVAYVGILNLYGAPVRNVGIVAVLEGILDSISDPGETDGQLTQAIRDHIDTLTPFETLPRLLAS